LRAGKTADGGLEAQFQRTSMTAWPETVAVIVASYKGTPSRRPWRWVSPPPHRV